LFSHLIILKVK